MTENSGAKEFEGFDPLLECLVILAKLNNHPLSHEALRAGLPLVNHCLTPTSFIRAAERAALIAKVVKRPLHRISPLVLPVVLILKNNEACILQRLYKDKTAEIILAETGDTIKKSLAELQESYSGYAIFIQPLAEVESRIEEKTVDKHSWFWGTFWRYRYIYTQVLIASFLINIFTLLTPLFIMNVYDRVVPNNVKLTLWVLSLGILVIFIFDLILRLLRSYYIDLCAKRADVLISSILFQRVLGMQLRYKPTSVGSFSNNLREFEGIRDFFTSATLVGLIDLPFLILFLVLIWYLGGFIVWAPLLAIPVILIWAWFFEKPLNEAVMQAMQGANQKYAILVETIGGLETLKCLRAEGQIQEKWEKYTASTALHGLRSRFYSGLVVNFAYYVQQSVSVAVVILGVYAIYAGKLTLGALIACSILASRVLAPLTSLASLTTRYQQAKQSLIKLNEIEKLPQERPLKSRFIHRPLLKGDIEFENVSFHYPGQKTAALTNVSFKIKAGEKVALIGKIGSGKTTIEKLLLSLYTPQEGSILIDGVDIREIDPIDLRRNIGYVPQEFLLFYGTLRDNIAMGMPWASDEAVLAAASMSGVDSFVKHHPAGYGMIIGERGEGLSGGQRQAIAMARAILPNPSILLLDEPTSAMDNTSEQELLTRLRNYIQPKTLVIVTHRSALLTLVDRLIIVDNGRIVLDGDKSKVLTILANAKPQIKQNE